MNDDIDGGDGWRTRFDTSVAAENPGIYNSNIHFAVDKKYSQDRCHLRGATADILGGIPYH
jgi:hypothetical protein